MMEQGLSYDHYNIFISVFHHKSKKGEYLIENEDYPSRSIKVVKIITIRVDFWKGEIESIVSRKST